MEMFEYYHRSFVEQLTDSVMHAATYQAVGAMMRGHGLMGALLIGAGIITVVWLVKRVF